MKIHRFYIPEAVAEKLENNMSVEITKDDTDRFFDGEEFIHQVFHVLRFKEGDILHVFNGNVGEFRVSLMSSHKKSLQLKLENKVEDSIGAANIEITLAMSLIKKDKFEFVVEKATELGVKDIIPMVTERVVQKQMSEDRLLRIIKEASEQCGRVNLPTLSETESMEGILKKTKNYDLCLYGNMEGVMSVKDLLAMSLKNEIQSMLVFVGPEGGWTEGEVRMFTQAGVQSISIHKNTLRAETAAVGLLGFLGGVVR
jgi:16S rRNA (uracil1498-N3)-methyltransferase